MNYWKSQGAPAEKLLVGLATYGHTFVLASSDTSVGAPESGPGAAGPYTRQAGTLAYYEVRIDGKAVSKLGTSSGDRCRRLWLRLYELHTSLLTGLLVNILVIENSE